MLFVNYNTEKGNVLSVCSDLHHRLLLPVVQEQCFRGVQARPGIPVSIIRHQHPLSDFSFNLLVDDKKHNSI